MGRWGLLLLLLVCWVSPAWAELGQARLSLVDGEVQVYTDESGEWLPAAANMPLLPGDRLWSPKGGRAEIQLRGGVYVRLGSATSVDVLALEERDIQFFVASGHAYVNNRKGGIDHIQLDTPLASVSSYDNSMIRIDVGEDGTTELGVLKGDSRVVTRRGDTLVEAGNSLYIDTFLSAELSPLSTPDRWERWNLKRDRALAAAGESRRYLPDELEDYAADLDDNGSWQYVADYGYAWVPRVTSVDWAPYQQGRWVWIGGDYVWLGYEPWGWAPYHYGRWAFSAGIGWCWVPPARFEVVWGPGYVGWAAGPNYVSWVPLAPREVYYGRRYYGPGTMVYGGGTVPVTNVVYQNVTINKAVTVVHQETFVTGRKVPLKLRGNPFTARDAHAGPPAIKPVKETRRPALKTVEQRFRPPERIVRQDPRKTPERYQLRRVEEGHGKPVKPVKPVVKEVPSPAREQVRGGPKDKDKDKDKDRESAKGRPAPVQTEQGVEVLRGSGQAPPSRSDNGERGARGQRRQEAPPAASPPADEARPAKGERPQKAERAKAATPRERGELPVVKRPTPRRVENEADGSQPAKPARGAAGKEKPAKPAAEKGAKGPKGDKGEKAPAADKGGKPAKE